VIDPAELLPWSIAGSYLEACNCEAICPCRRIGGRSGGRSTSGICEGALSWKVLDGRAGDIDLSELGAIVVSHYEDDEPGSPWTYYLYVDERGDERQQNALALIFTGALGGSVVQHFPWAWKDSNLVGWRPAPIEIEHTPARGWFRAGGGQVVVRVGDPVADQEPVTCVIPGHHRSGTELISELIHVDEGPLSFEVHGRCAYQSTFEYASDGE
jgi:hypothetical protein